MSPQARFPNGIGLVILVNTYASLHYVCIRWMCWYTRAVLLTELKHIYFHHDVLYAD